MSKSRRLCIEEILKDLQNLFDQKEDKQVQDLIDKNHTEAFRQMCYYQSYLDKKENTNMMKSEYLKFKGIYLCYKDSVVFLNFLIFQNKFQYLFCIFGLINIPKNIFLKFFCRARFFRLS